MICTSTVGEPTSRIACRFGIDDPSILDGIPDTGDSSCPASHPVILTPEFITALAGEKLTIPELRSQADVRILEGVVHRVPRLGMMMAGTSASGAS